jgi:ribosomal protein S18 acetylase RimI-like enzyme
MCGVSPSLLHLQQDLLKGREDRQGQGQGQGVVPDWAAAAMAPRCATKRVYVAERLLPLLLSAPMQQQQHRRLATILSVLRTSSSVVEAEAVEILLPDRHTSKAGAILVRRATVEDIPSLRIVTHYGFANSSPVPTDAEAPDEMADKQHWGAFEDGRAVSQLYAHDWTLGGGSAGCRLAAVSGVGTLPEFRRLGLLRTMMATLFEDMMKEGQHVAALLATQAAIYQRYGYSEGVRNCRSYSVDTVDVKFLDGDGGSMFVGRETLDLELEPTLQRLYEGYIEGRACCLAWDSPNKGRRVAAELHSEDGYTKSSPPVYCAVARDEHGDAKGYCLYTTQSGWGSDAVDHPTRSQRLSVREFIWTSMDAYRSIWTFLAVRKSVSVAPCCARNPNICQDRLGTNIGNVEKRRETLSAEHARSSRRDLCPQRPI